MKKICNNILAALILWLPLVACGSSSLSIDNSSGTASSGDTGTITSDGGDSDGSTITESSPLGDTGNVDDHTAINGTDVSAGNVRPVSLPSGTFDPSFITIAKVFISAQRAVVTGAVTLGKSPVTGAIVTAVMTRAGITVTSLTTLTASTGSFALSINNPKEGDLIFVSSSIADRTSNTVQLEVTFFGKVDEQGHPLFGVGGANNISAATLYFPADISVDSVPTTTAQSLSRSRKLKALTATTKAMCAVDHDNNRVLIYNLSGNNPRYAQVVLGQANFVSDTPTVTETGLSAPQSCTIDAAGMRIFVADAYRIVVYDISNGLKSGMAASRVLGENDLSTTSPAGSCNDSHRTFSKFLSLSYDGSNHRLFVADAKNNRVLVFSVGTGISDISNCMAASNVIGQTSFSGTTALAGSQLRQGLSNPTDVQWDPNYKRLYVYDQYHSRIAIYDLSGSLPESGLAASFVIGKKNPDDTTAYTKTGYSVGQQITFGTKLLVSPDGEYLYATDYTLTTGTIITINIPVVKRFKAGASLANAMTADLCLGLEGNSCSSSGAANPESSFGKTLLAGSNGGLTINPTTGDLFVADSARHRILKFAAATLASGSTAKASDCFGQITSSGHCDLASYKADNLNGSTLNDPQDIAIDEAHSRLFVADTGNGRVLVFNLKKDAQGSLMLEDAQADAVLGDNDSFAYPLIPTSPTDSDLHTPSFLAYHDGLLFVGDAPLFRISVFQVASGATNTLTNNMKASFFIKRLVGGGVSNLSLMKAVVDPQEKFLLLEHTQGVFNCIDLNEGGISLRTRITNYVNTGTLQQYSITAPNIRFGAVSGALSKIVPMAVSNNPLTPVLYIGNEATSSWNLKYWDYSKGCSGYISKMNYQYTMDLDGLAPNAMAISSDERYLFMPSPEWNAILVVDRNGTPAPSGAQAAGSKLTVANMIGAGSWTDRTPGVGDNEFNNPTAMACTSDDKYCYVIDRGNNRGIVVKNILCSGLSPTKSNCQ